MELSSKEKAKAYLAQRQLAYHQTFNKEDQAVKAVLEDLANFCRADESCFHADPRVHAALEGRREVWLRIQQHLNLEFDSLCKTYKLKDDR